MGFTEIQNPAQTCCEIDYSQNCRLFALILLLPESSVSWLSPSETQVRPIWLQTYYDSQWVGVNNGITKNIQLGGLSRFYKLNIYTRYLLLYTVVKPLRNEHQVQYKWGFLRELYVALFEFLLKQGRIGSLNVPRHCQFSTLLCHSTVTLSDEGVVDLRRLQNTCFFTPNLWVPEGVEPSGGPCLDETHNLAYGWKYWDWLSPLGFPSNAMEGTHNKS